MAGKDQLDFAAAWQQFVGQWERQINDLSTTVSGNEMFAGPINQVAKLTYAARSSMDGAMEKLVEAMRLASRAQLSEVIERLDRIEERLDQLVAHTVPPSPAATGPEPRRTRRAPTA